jgi:hypothetical protein
VSQGFAHSVLKGLTRNVAFTAPAAEDHRLRGRTYAVPFEEVWQAAGRLLGGGLAGWELRETDDQDGILRGVAPGRVDWLTGAITIRITLDHDAQTRVDGLAASRTGRWDLGANARHLHRFFTALDRELEDRRGTPPSAWRLDRSAPSPTGVG